MNAQHTPTPWRLMPKHNRYIAGNNEAGIDVIVADTGAESVAAHKQRAIDNAAHIVKCVNAHDALVAALKFAKESIVHNRTLDEARNDRALNEAMVAVENRITSALAAAGETP